MQAQELRAAVPRPASPLPGISDWALPQLAVSRNFAELFFASRILPKTTTTNLPTAPCRPPHPLMLRTSLQSVRALGSRPAAAAAGRQWQLSAARRAVVSGQVRAPAHSLLSQMRSCVSVLIPSCRLTSLLAVPLVRDSMLPTRRSPPMTPSSRPRRPSQPHPRRRLPSPGLSLSPRRPSRPRMHPSHRPPRARQ